MCWTCDHPEATRQDYYDHLDSLMRARGWMVQAVEGTRLYAPFAYTVGLTDKGLPELLVTGLDGVQACELLNHCAHHSLDEPFVAGEVLQDGPWLFEVVRVEVPSAHVLTAVELFGPAVRALQLAWADAGGRWPWEKGHHGQPVFGVRARRGRPDAREASRRLAP